MNYYDTVLLGIPTSILGLLAITTYLVGIPLSFAVPISTVPSLAIIGHAMFVNAPGHGPTTQPQTQTTSTPLPETSSAAIQDD